MTTEEQFKLNGSGSTDEIEETAEEVQAAHIKLSALQGRDGQLTTMGKTELSLLKSLDAGPANTDDRFTSNLRHANFIDDDERMDHIAAYNEAIYLGMDTEFNIQVLEGLKGTNRKGGFKNNLIAAFLDGISHQKYTSNTPKGGSSSGSSNPRSPLS